MNSKYMKAFATFFYTAVSVLMLSCSGDPDFLAGSASQSGNGIVCGMVVSGGDTARSGILVTLRSHDYDPVNAMKADTFSSRTTHTDTAGFYKFNSLPADTYTIEASSRFSGQKMLHFNVIIGKNEKADLEADTLKKLGKLRLYLSDTLKSAGGYVYIPGTSFGAQISTAALNNGYVEIDSIPASVLPGIYYANNSQVRDPHLLSDSISIVAGETVPVTLFNWQYSRKLYLNTSSGGAGVSGTVSGFPILIRLSAANFNFSTANLHGEDIRFTKSDGESLPCEIEQWDTVSQTAALWVRLDTIHGNDSSQYIVMYWGNPSATTPESDGKTVFDTTSGFEGVWHMAGNGTAFDATVNRYDGTPYGLTSAAAVPGAIGTARSFDGNGSYIAMPNTASGKLDMPQNGTYTMSMWAYADTIDTLWHVIAGKGHEQYYMKFKCFGNNSATWEFVEFQDQKGWGFTEDSIPPAPGAGQWVYLTGVRSGAKQYLYINGTLVSDSIHIQIGNYAQNRGDDFLIGRSAREVTIPNSEGWCYFKGMVDEVRVMDVALTADWIKLSYMNQKTEDRLVTFR